MAYGERLNHHLTVAVRVRMTRQNIQQTALCAALGLEQSAVSRRLNGLKAITVTELPAIAAVLDTTPGDLLDEAWTATLEELGEPGDVARLGPVEVAA